MDVLSDIILRGRKGVSRKEDLVVNYQLNCNGCIEVANNIEGDITPEQLCEQLIILYKLGDNYYTIEQKSDIVMNFRDDLPTHFLELVYIKGNKYVLVYDLNGSFTIQDAANATNGYLDCSGDIICNIVETYLFNTGSDGKYYGVDYCKKLIDTYFK